MMRQFFVLILVVLLTLTWSAVESQVRPSAALPFGATFVNSGQALGGETGNGVALGDLDGDGDTDAFVVNDYDSFKAGSLHVWLNEGNGFFSSGSVFGTEDSYKVALADLDGDGDLDALVVGVIPAQVWLNEGGYQGGNEGEFAAGVSFGSFTSYGVALGNVDNDNDLDALVVGNSNQVWLNDGTAAFTAGPALPFLYSRSAVLADMDDDDFADAIIADSQDGSSNRVWWNDGNWDPGPGSFTAGDALPTTGLMHGTAVANLDGDDQSDIFLAGSGQEQIFWNEGSRNFSTAGPLPLNDLSNAVALADVDGDVDLDAVVANGGSGTFDNQIWRNDGGRVFMATQSFVTPAWNRGLGLADLNGDDSPDVFIATTGEDQVWFNQNTTPIANEEGWQIQAVDVRGNTGHHSSLVLDANGYPHISYNRTFVNTEESVTYLMYAHWDGVRWHDEVVTTDVHFDNSLALDANGKPHIAYIYESNDYRDTLAYTYWDGTAWQRQNVDSVGFPASIALGTLVLDSNSRPHISYNTYSNNSGKPELLNVAHWDDATWQIQTVENGTVYESILALDANDTLHLSYAIRDAFAFQLKYAFWDGATWQTENLDGELEDEGVFVTSLALDAAGNPHIGYVLDNFVGGDALKYVYWDGAGWQYETITTIGANDEIPDSALDLDSGGNPHLLYFLNDLEGGVHSYRYTFWDGASWQEETLDSTDTEPSFLLDHFISMVLDANDNLHASYFEPRYKDLRYITWAANWQIRTVESGTADIPSIDVQNTNPAIGYYDPGAGQVKLASWAQSWQINPLDFVSDPVTDLALDVGSTREHASYYDADNQRLLYSYWDGAMWQLEVVDEAGDVGRYNDLVLLGNADGNPRIAYWDDTTLRIKLAVRDPNVLLWNIHPNLASPPLNANSGPLSTAVLPGGDMGVAYYDGVNGDLRLAVWDSVTATWTDELVEGAGGDVGRLNSLQTDGTEGEPVVAYLGQGALRFAYKVGGYWQIQDVPGTEEETITSLSLELGFNSRQRARIAYTTANGELRLAILYGGVWETEIVAGEGGDLNDVSLARDGRLHLAYTHAAAGLQYAFRTALLDVNTAVPGPPTQNGGAYNPLDGCQAIIDLFFGGDSLKAGITSPPAVSLLQNEPLNDLAIFGAMTQLFNASPAGQSYINLYRQYGAEMGQLGLEDPQLLWDAYGTLQNFLPGLEALVTGQGDEMIVTQEMVDDALDIWQGLAAVGSPELTAVINDELAQYNNLQDFVGLTFDEWAMAIGVTPPPENIYLPVIHND